MRPWELYRYNPALASPEELEATFVGHGPLLQQMLRALRERAQDPVNQHFLLVGPRGSGKTNLLLLLRYRVERDAKLRAAYLPLQAAEEEYSINSLRDFFARILEMLVEAVPEPVWLEAQQQVQAEPDDDSATERCLEVLRAFHTATGRKLLLLVDNLDLILGDQIRAEMEQKQLRAVLMNEGFLVLIGTAPTYFKEVRGYDKPFYQFFRVLYLDELKLEEVEELLRKRAEWNGNEELLHRFAEVQTRLSPLYRLTGGNPRLVLSLYQLVIHRELPEARTAFLMLLEELTPYYKDRLEKLAPQLRKVLDTFAHLGHPATPTELAELTRLPVNQVNTYLKRLQEQGFVHPARQERRRTRLYVVSERLFRLWHQMRFSRTSRQRLEFLVEFLRLWHGEPSSSTNFACAALARSQAALAAQNWGTAREAFHTALEQAREVERRKWWAALVNYFRAILGEETAAQVGELLTLLEREGFTDEVELLAPFRYAVEYWRRGRDMEVLDRLNPEVRTVVEDIVKGRGGNE
ncbi:MAG TPA: hypothetical protein EYP85_17120 [Armatimonadetes bacterium]|nr:hypothetical protein [Armatimonadota bacterium]